MNSLSARIALLLVAVFIVTAGLLMLAMQMEAMRTRPLSIEMVVGVLGLVLLFVWCALWPLTRRIARVQEAVRTLLSSTPSGHVRPLRLADADAQGDDVARLAAQAEQLSEHLAGQSATLAQAARSRRELLANVSHDLRTPLASMQGYLELLLLRQGNLETAEAQNYLQTAARQSERLGRLVGDLFELTRLEADDTAPQAEPFVLAELAYDVVQKFAPEAERRGVALLADVETAANATVAAAATGPAMVQADLALIERVLANLVDNALRHTPAGGAVTIAAAVATAKTSGEPRAQVEVRDTGTGIAAEDLPGIFERYERSSRVGDSGAGTHGGLGLAIAQRIVQLHGSQLQVHSAPGAGTRVWFDLRLAEPRSMAPHAPARARQLLA